MPASQASKANFCKGIDILEAKVTLLPIVYVCITSEIFYTANKFVNVSIVD